MRNPSTLSKSDDLSCLTSSSTSSNDQQPHASFPILIDNDNNATSFTSSYLPKVIDPREWHHHQQPNGARKRKERQDSTSSITQDRKFVRSNSEEYLPTVDYEVIRRVSSHDEIKNSVYVIRDDDDDDCVPNVPSDDKNNGGGSGGGGQCSGRRHRSDVAPAMKSNNNEVQEILRETYRRSETSPARSRTFDFSHKLRVSMHTDSSNQCADEYGDVDNMRDR